jgi:O-antigen/teichoic acid export membrane protein
MKAESAIGGKLLVRNTALNFGAQAIPLLIGVAVIPYVIAKLGTDEFGILSLAWMVFSYFSLFDLGLGRATVKYVAEYIGLAKREEIPGLVWTSIWLQLLLAIGGALLAAALIPFGVEKVLKIPPTLIRDARNAFFILAASLPILLLGNTFRGVLEAAQRFDLVNYVKVPSGISTFLLAAIGAGCGLHVTGIVLLLVPAKTGVMIAYMILCFRIFPSLKQRLRFDMAALRPLSSFGGWVMVSNIAAPLLTYLERLMIASILSVGALAFYAAPCDLITRVTIFPASMALTLFPYFSYHGSGGLDKISRISSRSFKYLLLFSAPVVAVAVFFAHRILFLWLGLNFAEKSTEVLQLLAVAYFINILAYIPFTSVQALGRPDLKAFLDMAEVPLFALLSWVLLVKMGIEGAALAKLIVSIVDSIGLFWFARRLGAFSLRDFFEGSLPRGVGVSAALFLSVFALQQLSLSIPVVVVALAFLFSVYGVIVWKLAIDESERALVRGLFVQIPVGR